jgi:hypothetical protein
MNADFDLRSSAAHLVAPFTDVKIPFFSVQLC